MTARLLLVLLLLVTPIAAAQDGPEAPTPAPRANDPSPAARKASLAVLPFAFRSKRMGKRNRDQELMIRRFDRAALSRELVAALVASRKFVVVDREHMDALQEELNLTAGGFVDPARAVKAGEIVGADYLLMGEVSALDVRVDWRPIAYGKGKAQRIVTARLAADLRIVETRTSKIVAAERAAVEWEETKMFPNRFEDAKMPADLLEALQQKLVGDLVRRTIDRIYPIKVTDVRGPEHILDRGQAMGLAVGQVLDVYQEGGEAAGEMDESLGEGEVKLGQLRVTAVEAERARARAVSGGPFPRGTVCRAARPASTSPVPARKQPSRW